MEEYKVISVGIYNPRTSVFKSKKNDKAKCDIIKCSSSDSCDLYKKGQCTMANSIGWIKCPYSKFTSEEGFTSRANNFSKWISDRQDKYSGIPLLKGHSKIISSIGGYYLLPYSHMEMCNEVPFLKSSRGFFDKGQPFIKKEDLTVDNINKLLNFRPQALFGGEIESYQKEEVPRFIEHLRDLYPELFSEVLKVNNRLENYLVKNYVGRKAVLSSVNINIGFFTDIHGKNWTWDGEWLHCKEKVSIFGLSNTNSETKVKPSKEVEVKITDNNQVNSLTIFLD